MSENTEKKNLRTSKEPEEDDDTILVMQSNGSTQSASVVRPVSPNLSHIEKLEENVEDMFVFMTENNEDIINDFDIEQILLKINDRFGREYNKDDAIEFFNALDVSNNGVLNLSQFKRAFLDIVNNFNLA